MSVWRRVAAGGWLFAAACGGEPPVGPPVPAAIVITASDTLTAPNGTLAFSATVVDSQGQVLPVGPVAWSVSDTLRGRIAVDGGFTGGPWVGRLYVRAALAEPVLAESVAVRIVPPGTVRWTWAAADAGGVMPTIGGPALAPDGTVYVLVETGGFPDFPATLVALSPAGVVQWTRALTKVTGNYPVVTPGDAHVWVVGQRVYLVAPDGTLLWDSTTVAPSPSFKSGAATSSQLIAAQGIQLAVYAPASVSLAWETPDAPASDWLVPPTLTSDGRLLAKRTEDTLFVFSAATGQLNRVFLDPDTALDKRVFGVGTVPVADRYYLPTTNRLAAYDTAGPLLWLTEATGRGVTEPAVAPDGTLYVQHRRFGLESMNPDGTTRWFQRAAGEVPRWSWYGGPALAQGGIVYAAGQGGFFSYDSQGTALWTHVVDSAGVAQAFLGAPAIAPDGTVYTFTSTHLYAFWGSAPPEPNSPWPMWRHDAQRTGWAR